MNRGFGFILAVPVFFIAIFFALQVNSIQQEQELYEEYIINYAIDYATDAAAQELLEQANLGTDYQDWGRINLDPETAKTTFETVMLLSYGFPMTEKSYDMMEANYMPIFCVAGYDGYYVYEEQKTDKNFYELQGAHKIPYSLQKGTNYYALNLGMDNCRKLSNGHLTVAQLYDEGITKRDALYSINSIVSDDLTYRFQQYQHRKAYEKNDPRIDTNIIYLPMGLTTMTKVNAIEGPTVISLIDEWDLNTTHAVSAFSIGGAKLEPARMVAGYHDKVTGEKWYCYADLLPGFGTDDFEKLAIDNMFTSVNAAAEAGYYYDPFYMD